MYEAAESLTKFLQLGRHTRIAINGVISDFIPKPDVRTRRSATSRVSSIHQ